MINSNLTLEKHGWIGAQQMRKYDLKRIPELENNWENIKHLFKTKTFSSGTTLLQEGTVAKYIYLVEKGALRLWCNDEGRDITVQFFFEEQMVSSFESFYLEKESRFSIECIEDTTVSMISKESLELLMREFPELNTYMTSIICKRFIDYTNSFLSRIKDAPEKRYQEMLENEPELINRVSHHYIASYLGITSVSLSRIRNRIKNKKMD